MEEIKVGEYVRTNRWIGKIEEIKTTYVRMNGNHDKSYKLDIFKSIWFTRKDFIKHSFNIIDLIEEGDYVNGIKVINIDCDGKIYIAEDLGEPHFRGIFNGCFYWTILDFKYFDIKSIVTKEMMESVEYRLN